MKNEKCKLEIGAPLHGRIPCLRSRLTFHVSRWAMLAIALGLLLPILSAFAQTTDDKNSTFFMGRIKYSSNDGDDCSHVGEELMSLVSRASTLKLQDERRIKFTDLELFETPFVFMNGHNSFVLSEAEVGNIRKYLSHRSEEHTSELQSLAYLVCRLLLEKK